MRTPKSKVLYVCAAALGVFGLSGLTANAAYKTVTVREDGKKQVLRGMTFGTVQDFLKNHGVSYSRAAKVSPAPSADVQDGMDVTIQEPKDVKVADGQRDDSYRTFAKTVRELLSQRNIALAPSDKMNVSLNSKLSDGEKIQIQRIKTKVSVEHHELPFQTVRRNTENLYQGQTKVLTHGVKGKEEITSRRVYVNGKLVKHSVEKKIVQQPVTKVIEVGSKARSVHLASRSYNPLAGNARALRVRVTAYAAGGLTATGDRAVPGVAAVDPSVIPLGTRITVPGYGTVVARDTGGEIRGDHIDICLPNRQDALRWGARELTVYVGN